MFVYSTIISMLRNAVRRFSSTVKHTEDINRAKSLAQSELTAVGYNPDTFWEQPIVWGDHDAFQHVNNVRYSRFFESARMHWLQSFGTKLGGKERADAMLAGKGLSLILRSMNINFKKYVTYPDTLLIGHQAGPLYTYNKDKSEKSILSRTHFELLASAYSYTQECIVAESSSTLVWFDYGCMRKCDPGDETWKLVKEYYSDSCLGQPGSAFQPKGRTSA